MGPESDEDMSLYDWQDDDEGYPPDSVHTLGWKLHEGFLKAWCHEHDMQVHHRGIDPDTAAEDRAEWISERRTELARACTNKMRTRKPESWLNNVVGKATPAALPTWVQQQVADQAAQLAQQARMRKPLP